MFHGAYDDMVRFASEGKMDAELRLAKAAYIARTGELFASDAAFERRLASFLEWYVLDRATSFAPQKTPAHLYIDAQVAAGAAPETLAMHRALAHGCLSLYEFRSARGDQMQVTDLLTNQRHQVYERRRPAGLEAGDILEARLLELADRQVFTEAFDFAPRAARRAILKRLKAARKAPLDDAARLDLVHRVAYLSHRCERYRHVDPKTIFAEL